MICFDLSFEGSYVGPLVPWFVKLVKAMIVDGNVKISNKEVYNYEWNET